MSEMPRSNYDQALDTAGFDLETLRTLVMLIRDWYEQTGRWPSAVEVRTMVKRPS